MRQVTGWADATVVRYPGMSCEWEQAAVEIYYRTWDGEFGSYRWSGEFGQLIRRLQTLVQQAGA